MPCGPLSRVLHGDALLDLLGDSDGVPAQRVLLDTGIEERDPLALGRLALRCFAPVDFRQRVSDGLCAAVQIVVAGFFGDLGEDALTKASSLLPRSPRAMTSRAISTERSVR